MTRPTAEPVTDRVLAIIADYLDVPVEELTPERELEDLGVDSLDFVQILFEIEETLDVEVPGDNAKLKDRLRTIGDVGELISELEPAAEKARPPEPRGAAGDERP